MNNTEQHCDKGDLEIIFLPRVDIFFLALKGMKREKSPDEIGFIMACDLNQLVLAKANDNFGSYLLCNTVFLDMLRTLLLVRTSWFGI